MKHIGFGLMAFLLVLLFCFPLMAQLQVEKFPGEQTTVTFDFPQSEETMIDGFKLLVSDSSEGNYTEFKTVVATAREFRFNAEASPKFYRVVSYKGPLQGGASYCVLVNIKLKGAVGVSIR